jgi:phospholipid/cholesterol/gamma-HCH transport system substrate-binding protein
MDSTIAHNVDKTMDNLQKSSKGLNENMNAAKENFLLRGYFKKKTKAAEKAKEVATEKEDEKAKTEEQKTVDEKK